MGQQFIPAKNKSDMSYLVNDIFYSLQGEGRQMGRAAVFVRFSGCNLKCSFCDTDFTRSTPMEGAEIVDKALRLVPDEAWHSDVKPMVVLTGGEPTLQADNALVDQLHAAGFDFVAMESNGTRPAPDHLDWLTVSPKSQVTVRKCQELKCIFDGETDVERWKDIQADYYYLQPCDVGDSERNRAISQACVDYIKLHPEWRLSVQVHKWLGFK